MEEDGGVADGARSIWTLVVKLLHFQFSFTELPIPSYDNRLLATR